VKPEELPKIVCILDDCDCKSSRRKRKDSEKTDNFGHIYVYFVCFFYAISKVGIGFRLIVVALKKS
jgi:hypothetical protein